MLNAIFLDVIELTILTGAMIGVILLLSPLITKRYQVGWRKAVWLVIAIRMLIPYSSAGIEINIPFLDNTMTSLVTSQNEEDDAVEASNNWNIFWQGNANDDTTISAIQNGDNISAGEVTTESFAADITPTNTTIDNTITADATTVETTGNNYGVHSNEKWNAFMTKLWNANSIKVISWIWIIVMILKMSVHAIEYFMFKKMVYKQRIICQDVFVLAKTKELCTRYSIKKIPQIYWAKTIRTPMVFGYKSAALLLPYGLNTDARTKEDEKKIELMIHHEILHLKNKDIWYKALILLATDIYWFHPLVYIMKQKAYQDVELRCDYLVGKNISKEERVLYSQVILEFVTKKMRTSYSFSTCMGENKRSLKERITAVFDTKDKKDRKTVIIGCLVALLLGGIVIPAGDDFIVNGSTGEEETLVENENGMNIESQPLELTINQKEVSNYYNYYTEENETMIYIVEMDGIYEISKVTGEVSVLYEPEEQLLMGNTLLGNWIYFTEYESYSEGNIYRLNVQTLDKELVLEHHVAYECSATSTELYFKLTHSEVVGYQYDEDGIYGEAFDNKALDYLYWLDSNKYTDPTELSEEMIAKMEGNSSISDAIYVSNCTDGNELYYQLDGEAYRNVVMYDGKTEDVLFSSSDVALLVPEGIYYYKDASLLFYDFVTKESNEFFSYEPYQDSFGTYVIGNGNKFHTYDTQYLYGTLYLEEDCLTMIRVNRDTGEMEELYEWNLDMSEYYFVSVSVCDDLLFMGYRMENESGNTGINLEVYNIETGECYAL